MNAFWEREDRFWLKERNSKTEGSWGGGSLLCMLGDLDMI